mmetsp:Transcript_19444/g.49285  ORF Transcript_19444/g.49285 Transcript_19444/m.49285 type:complete len:264 (-) Transcript_19444:30-821(-)
MRARCARTPSLCRFSRESRSTGFSSTRRSRGSCAPCPTPRCRSRRAASFGVRPTRWRSLSSRPWHPCSPPLATTSWSRTRGISTCRRPSQGQALTTCISPWRCAVSSPRPPRPGCPPSLACPRALRAGVLFPGGDPSRSSRHRLLTLTPPRQHKSPPDHGGRRRAHGPPPRDVGAPGQADAARVLHVRPQLEPEHQRASQRHHLPRRHHRLGPVHAREGGFQGHSLRCDLGCLPPVPGARRRELQRGPREEPDGGATHLPVHR